VGDDDQAGVGPAVTHCGEGGKDYRFIGRPGGSRHHRWRPATETKQRLVRWNRAHPFGDTVVAGIAEDADALGGHAKTGEAGGVVR
jgi:hypothetical protein